MNAGGPPPPPPPPPIPGVIPSSRLPSEIPSRPEMTTPPAVLASAMMKDRKPFTYTPGGLDLSEIRSPRMQRRLYRNAQSEGVKPSPLAQQPQQGHPNGAAAAPLGLPIQVLPMPGVGMGPQQQQQQHQPSQPKVAPKPKSVCGPAPPPPPFTVGLSGDTSFTMPVSSPLSSVPSTISSPPISSSPTSPAAPQPQLAKEPGPSIPVAPPLPTQNFAARRGSLFSASLPTSPLVSTIPSEPSPPPLPPPQAVRVPVTPPIVQEPVSHPVQETEQIIQSLDILPAAAPAPPQEAFSLEIIQPPIPAPLHIEKELEQPKCTSTPVANLSSSAPEHMLVRPPPTVMNTIQEVSPVQQNLTRDVYLQEVSPVRQNLPRDVYLTNEDTPTQDSSVEESSPSPYIESSVQSSTEPSPALEPSPAMQFGMEDSSPSPAVISDSSPIKQTVIDEPNIDYVDIKQPSPVLVAEREPSQVERISPVKEPSLVREIPSKEPTPIKQVIPSKEPTPIKQIIPNKEPTPIKQIIPSKEHTPIRQVIPTKETTPIKQIIPNKEPTPIKQVNSLESSPLKVPEISSLLASKIDPMRHLEHEQSPESEQPVIFSPRPVKEMPLKEPTPVRQIVREPTPVRQAVLEKPVILDTTPSVAPSSHPVPLQQPNVAPIPASGNSVLRPIHAQHAGPKRHYSMPEPSCVTSVPIENPTIINQIPIQQPVSVGLSSTPKTNLSKQTSVSQPLLIKPVAIKTNNETVTHNIPVRMQSPSPNLAAVAPTPVGPRATKLVRQSSLPTKPSTPQVSPPTLQSGSVLVLPLAGEEVTNADSLSTAASRSSRRSPTTGLHRAPLPWMAGHLREASPPPVFVQHAQQTLQRFQPPQSRFIRQSSLGPEGPAERISQGTANVQQNVRQQFSFQRQQSLPPPQRQQAQPVRIQQQQQSQVQNQQPIVQNQKPHAEQAQSYVQQPQTQPQQYAQAQPQQPYAQSQTQQQSAHVQPQQHYPQAQPQQQFPQAQAQQQYAQAQRQQQYPQPQPQQHFPQAQAQQQYAQAQLQQQYPQPQPQQRFPQAQPQQQNSQPRSQPIRIQHQLHSQQPRAIPIQVQQQQSQQPKHKPRERIIPIMIESDSPPRESAPMPAHTTTSASTASAATNERFIPIRMDRDNNMNNAQHNFQQKQPQQPQPRLDQRPQPQSTWHSSPGATFSHPITTLSGGQSGAFLPYNSSPSSSFPSATENNLSNNNNNNNSHNNPLDALHQMQQSLAQLNSGLETALPRFIQKKMSDTITPRTTPSNQPNQNGNSADQAPNSAEFGAPFQSRSFRVLQTVLDTQDDAEQGLSTSQALSENNPQHSKSGMMSSTQSVIMPQPKEGPTSSRFFRRLQTITDTLPDGAEPQGPIHIPTMRHVQPPSQHQPQPNQYHQQPAYQQQPGVINNAVNIDQAMPEPKKYMGGNIPSRSFRMLQAMTGSDDAPGPGQSDL